MYFSMFSSALSALAITDFLLFFAVGRTLTPEKKKMAAIPNRAKYMPKFPFPDAKDQIPYTREAAPRRVIARATQP